MKDVTPAGYLCGFQQATLTYLFTSLLVSPFNYLCCYCHMLKVSKQINTTCCTHFQQMQGRTSTKQRMMLVSKYFHLNLLVPLLIFTRVSLLCHYFISRCNLFLLIPPNTCTHAQHHWLLVSTNCCHDVIYLQI